MLIPGLDDVEHKAYKAFSREIDYDIHKKLHIFNHHSTDQDLPFRVGEEAYTPSSAHFTLSFEHEDETSLWTSCPSHPSRLSEHNS